MRFYARLGCGIAIVGTGLVAHAQSSAEDVRLIRKPQSAASPSPPPEPGQVSYLRRLVRDAGSAAERGDDAEARRLAERAYHVSVSYRAILADKPDCSPTTMVALAQRYGSTIGMSRGMSRTKSSAQPSSPPPKPTAPSDTPPPDLLTLVEARFREVSPQKTASSLNPAADAPLLRSTPNSTQAQSAHPASGTPAPPARAKRPATNAQPINSVQTIFDQPFQRSPKFETKQISNRSRSPLRVPTAAALAVSESNVPVVKSAADSNPNESSPSPAATPIPPVPPAIDEGQAAADSIPAPLHDSVRRLEAPRLLAKETAVDGSLQPNASTSSQEASPLNCETVSKTGGLSEHEPKRLLEESVAVESTATIIGEATATSDHFATQPADDVPQSAVFVLGNSLPRMAAVDRGSDIGERIALAMGIAMLICGFAMFGLSFRWV